MIHIHHQPHLYRTEDDHILCLSSAREFSTLPFWEGNRLVKQDHIHEIESSLGDSPQGLTKSLFRAIVILEDDGAVQWYIFDGQHRSSVLRKYFEDESIEDFQLLVMWKIYDAKDVSQIHKDFLDCNRASPIEWTVDPKMMTNAYMDALLTKFHGPLNLNKVEKKSKKQEKSFFREGKTKRPYLSMEKLREDVQKKYTNTGWTKTAEEFATQAFQVNEKLLESLSAKDKRTTLETSMLELGFALASADSYLWI
jgi:hypothetical protein